MADVKWIKITTNMFEDEKIDFIESLPEADAILVVWIKLLAQAGKCNANGFIFLTEQIPYDENMLAHKFKKSINIIKLALSTFKKLEMIELDERGYINIINWEKHQNIEGLEKIREQNRIRKARQREREKLGLPEGSHDNSHGTVTQGHATDIDIELELEEDKEYIIMSPYQNEYISILKKIKDYPLDLQKDLDYMTELEKRYPELDLVEAIDKFSIYIIDNPFNKKSNHRSQINTSFKKYVEWKTCLKKSNEIKKEYKDDNPFNNRGD